MGRGYGGPGAVLLTYASQRHIGAFRPLVQTEQGDPKAPGAIRTWSSLLQASTHVALFRAVEWPLKGAHCANSPVT